MAFNTAECSHAAVMLCACECEREGRSEREGETEGIKQMEGKETGNGLLKKRGELVFISIRVGGNRRKEVFGDNL